MRPPRSRCFPLEVRQHFLAENAHGLERLLVRDVPAEYRDDHQLVEADLLEAPDGADDFRRRADADAVLVEALRRGAAGEHAAHILLLLYFFDQLTDFRLRDRPRDVLRALEEVRDAVEVDVEVRRGLPAVAPEELARLVAVLQAEGGGDGHDLVVDELAHRFGLLDRRLVGLDQRPQEVGVGEVEHRRADSHLGCGLDRTGIAGCDPERRMGLLHDARQNAALGDGEVFAVPVEEVLCPHLRDGADRFLPHRARLFRTQAERVDLGRPAAAPGAELDAAVGDRVDVRDLFGDAHRMVDHRAEVEDAGHQPDAFRLHADRQAGEVRRRAVRVLLQAVMLGGPVSVEAGGIGGDADLDVVAQPARLALVPRPLADRGPLKDSELEWHDNPPSRRYWNARRLHAYCPRGATASAQPVSRSRHDDDADRDYW